MNVELKSQVSLSVALRYYEISTQSSNDGNRHHFLTRICLYISIPCRGKIYEAKEAYKGNRKEFGIEFKRARHQRRRAGRQDQLPFAIPEAWWQVNHSKDPTQTLY